MAYPRRKSGPMSRWGRGRRRYSRFDDDVRGGLPFNLDLNEETKKGILIIFLFVLAILSILGLFNLSGNFGQAINYLLALLLGGAKWLVPILLILWAYVLLRQDKYQIKFINYLGTILLIVGLAGLLHLRFDSWEALAQAKNGLGGGYLGAAIALPLLRLMNFWGALVVLIAIFLIGLLLTLETSIYGLMWPMKLIKFLAVVIRQTYQYLKNRLEERKLKTMVAVDDGYEEEPVAESVKSEQLAPGQEGEEEFDGPRFKKVNIGGAVSSEDAAESSSFASPKKFGKKIELPLSLLSTKSGKPTAGDIKANQEIIRKTLANFGISVEMVDVNVGPTVSQYTLRPADGVKLSRIINLHSDLALALAAHPIRIEAPIPGKSLVGIEIPNQAVAKVTMTELLTSKEFKERKNNLALALGKDVSGRSYFADLDRMPHLLIAGATGSGKSVCINSVIVSLLYQNNPDDLKFILVDPKRVELPVYNGIPYLLTPVITDVKRTVSALKWAIVEMERRFEILSKAGKRNIASYNEASSDRLPYIVFIIDELADLMAAAGNEIEAGIVRLAQMARAVGIHLILATQRPSIEVITGLIKANIPARIAFSVASLIDSRTILDASGAEKLVGRGDMLYLGPDISKPKRLQGVYLSDNEISSIIDYIKSQGEANYIEDIAGQTSSGASSNFAGSDDDPLIPECVEIIRQAGKASASLFQRRLKVGYARAARLLDLLEERGIIGPVDGAKPREVFLNKLGGVSAVEFAAKEHDLEGELIGYQPLEEEEPSFTAFDKKAEPEEATDEPVESELDLDINGEEVEDNPLLVEEDIAIIPERVEPVVEETSAEEEIVASEKEAAEEEEENITEEISEEPAAEEEEEAEDKTSGAKKKKFFSEDEWT